MSWAEWLRWHAPLAVNLFWLYGSVPVLALVAALLLDLGATRRLGDGTGRKVARTNAVILPSGFVVCLFRLADWLIEVGGV